ncbi:hypothetical protein K435DRAFT_785396 [Dendrothele bispora CBS 962.96]|uniref:Prolyl 4-hydroxylase alpha subunit domain-containing protein n=1 Tax=Dendrothele bispora (strain CBS 962.96) TaxID=1314807 RepID=A0A4S8KX46_DENBC|nr:hypothetical protein K435DRAFT_785396 [Dendrothele bispora CBS 962.96]
MSPTSTLIDFGATPLAESYSGFYAKILDDVFTPEECRELIERASSSPEGWQAAGLRAGDPNNQTVHPNFRNSERIYVVDDELTGRIFERVRSLVEEDIGVIEAQGQWGVITGKVGRKQGPTWKLTGLNSRLSFLRYGPGHFFKPHCDGLNDGPDGMSKSFVTMHIYLTDETTESSDETFYTSFSRRSTSGVDTSGVYDTATSRNDPQSGVENSVPEDTSKRLAGGSTRFWTADRKEFLDVEPKIGRVLIFQQRMLIHSGEEVHSGMKYTIRGDFMFRELKEKDSERKKESRWLAW